MVHPRTPIQDQDELSSLLQVPLVVSSEAFRMFFFFLLFFSSSFTFSFSSFSSCASSSFPSYQPPLFLSAGHARAGRGCLPRALSWLLDVETTPLITRDRQ